MENKNKNKALYVVLAIIGAAVVVAGIAYAVYKFLTPDYLDDFDDEFDEDFDDDFFDDEEEEVKVAAPAEEKTEEPEKEASAEEEKTEETARS